MRNRFLALLLALLLLCQTAAAAGMENFRPRRSYAHTFSDLTPASRHYENIIALYEYGFSIGRAGGSFGVNEPVSLRELLIFAARLRSCYECGDPERGPAQEGADGYLAYARRMGIVSQEFAGRYDRSATRAEVAHVLARTLPRLAPLNEELVTTRYALGQSIRDVTDATPYQADILLLYRAGIAVGSDETGSFHPDALITRGELASLLMRLALPASRVTLAWKPAYCSSASWGSIAPQDGSAISAPHGEAELRLALSAMLAREDSLLRLQYSPGEVSAADAKRMSEQSLAFLKENCEQLYNRVESTLTPSLGSLTLSFSASGVTELPLLRKETLARAIAVHDGLWAEGQLTAEMSETEKAWVYYNWILDHCRYDTTLAPASHLAHSLFFSGSAVCDGYTGAYNLLLKLEGIACRGFSNDAHIWTAATLDGVPVHIDSTWGDTEGFPRAQFFAMSEQESFAAHAW